MTETPDFYTLLGLSAECSEEEIRRAYHEAALRMHPDVNRRPGATELFLGIQQAYEVLSNPQRRAAYDQAAPLKEEAAAPFVFNVEYSRSVIPPLNEPQLVYTLIRLSTQRREDPALPTPLNLCLILDRSTSMQGERMDTLKSASISLIRQLSPTDKISIVTFSDRSEALFTIGQPMDRNRLETLIRQIQPSGGTEIFHGLATGVDQVRQHLNRAFVNHIILITDGRTYGDEANCLKLADEAAQDGISITAMGIGNEWNDAFLDDLSSRTGGTCFYIAHAGQIPTYFQNTLRKLTSTSAENVTLNIKTGASVELLSAFRMQPEPDPLPAGEHIRLGNLPISDALSILLEFKIDPISRGVEQLLLAHGDVSARFPSEKQTDYRAKFHLALPVEEHQKNIFPPTSILKALSNISLFRMQEKARKEALSGKIDSATLRLQHLATHLLSQGKRQLAHTVLMEANRLQQTQAFSQTGEKEIKYGTRALMLSPGLQRDKT